MMLLLSFLLATIDATTTYYDLPIVPFVTPCVCSNEWWNASYYQSDTSCRCDGGIKQISLQYIGDSMLSSLIFYHSGNRFYENCTFYAVQPNEIVSCISYPYSQFDRDLHIQAMAVDDTGYVCDSYIDVSCTTDEILDAHSTQCTSLPVVGYVDVNNYICDASSKTSDNNSDGKGRRRRMLHRRLLSSDSSDSSDSASVIVQSQATTSKPTAKPTAKPTMKPTMKLTAKPTTTTISTLKPTTTTTTTTTSTTAVTVQPTLSDSPGATATFVNISVHVLQTRACNCDSFDSWDDTHDVVDGEIVKFIQDPQDQSFSFDDVDGIPARAQDRVQASDMHFTAADDANCVSYGYIYIFLYSYLLMLTF